MSIDPGLISRLPENLSGDPDRDLTLAFQRGDKGAYQAIYELHSKRVRGVCNRMLPCHEDAQEAAQETFLRVYQALARFNGRYQLGPWITRIATNVCLDHLRTKARKPEQLRDDELLDLETSRVPDTDDPEARVLRLADNRRIHRVLASLPPMHRAAIVLRDFEGLSYAEAAVVLDITEAQVKALIHRARKSFRRSWTSSLAAFLLPWRHIDRVRATVDDSTRDQASHLLVSSSQMAASCSAVLQQCGQYVVERAAGVFTAVVVGSMAAAPMAVAVGSTMTDRPPPAETMDTVSMASATDSEKKAEVRDSLDDGTRERDQDKAEPPLPVPEAESTAPPEPAEAPSEDAGVDAPAEPAPSEPAPPPAEPTGFSSVFSTDMAASRPPCSCLDQANVVAESVQADVSGVESFDQEFVGSAEAAGTQSYGLWLQHASRSLDDHSMEFTLQTEEGGYRYSATGHLLSMTSTEWGGWRLTYEGTYHLGSRPSTSELMPIDGTYRLEIMISAVNDRVVDAGFSLAEKGN